MRILTNDPSIRAWGWAVIEYKNGFTRVLDSGCIKTENEANKRRIRKSDDMVRRLEELTDALSAIHVTYTIDWMVSELPHGSQSASASKSLGAVTGLAVGFSKANNLPISWFSERDAKKHLTGRNSVSKRETIEAVAGIYGDKWITDTKYIDEAVADALAVFHVAKAKSEALIFMSK